MHAEPEVGRWIGLDGFPVNTAESQRFFDLIQQHHVKKVLVSHVHAYDEQFIMKNSDGTVTTGNGIDFVLSGGAGAELENNPNLTLNDFHFVEFFVNECNIRGPLLWRVFGTPRKSCI
jgi:Icc protein